MPEVFSLSVFTKLRGAFIQSRRVRATIAVGLLILLVHQASAQQKKRETQSAKAESAVVSPEEALKLEAVVTTDLGAFRFEFFPEKAPKHVQQFIRLARSGYYDGSAFHRAIPRAFVQGG